MILTFATRFRPKKPFALSTIAGLAICLALGLTTTIQATASTVPAPGRVLDVR